MIWRAAPISVENSTGKSWDSRWTMFLEQCASRGTSFMLRFTWMRLWKFSLCHVNEPVNCDAWVQMIDIFWAQIICLLYENGVLVRFGPCKAIGCKGASTMKLASMMTMNFLFGMPCNSGERALWLKKCPSTAANQISGGTSPTFTTPDQLAPATAATGEAKPLWTFPSVPRIEKQKRQWVQYTGWWM